jgi:hypothetical protein
MNPIYTIDFTRLIGWLVPPRLRVEFTLNWLKSLVLPIVALYNTWKNYQADVDYRVNLTGQVCRLRGALNDAFDMLNRRIIITDTPDYTVMLIHLDEAQNPIKTHLPNQGTYYDNEIPVIHDNSAYTNGGVDFNVIIPFALDTNQENRLKSILNTYKLASKRYKILYT